MNGNLNLEEFLSEMMDTPPHQVTLDHFKGLVARLQLSEAFVNKHIRFKSDRYYWKYVLRNDDIEILVCGWMPGQKSTIHLHKGASLNVTRVLFGTITEEIYEEVGSEIKLLRETDRNAGELATTERYQYHQLVNNSTENSVTLHFYSPVRSD